MSDSIPRVRTLFRSRLIRVLDYRCPGHDGRDEIPQGHEIVLTRAGAFQRKDAHGAFLADPNQILFYNQGQPYDISHPVGGRDYTTVFIFNPSLLIEIMRIYEPEVENNPYRVFPRSHFTFATPLQMLQYRLLRADKNYIDPLEMEEQIMTAAGEIIHALYQARPTQERRSSPKTLRAHADQIQAVRTFLNAHVQSSMQLERISSAVHLSPYHLCRVFKQNTGMTLHQYLMRLRLFNAAEYILESPKTRLDLIALEYGFSNHGNFSTAFRQTFGISPSALRSKQLHQMSKILKA
jgi:AraC-like DNA-binding protein